MRLRVDRYTVLHKGQTYAARFDHYPTNGTVMIYAAKAGSQATVRMARIRNGQTSVEQADVLGSNVFDGKRVKIDLPIAGGDGLDPYLFIDCTAGIVRVEVISESPFDTQVRG